MIHKKIILINSQIMPTMHYLIQTFIFNKKMLILKNKKLFQHKTVNSTISLVVLWIQDKRYFHLKALCLWYPLLISHTNHRFILTSSKFKLQVHNKVHNLYLLINVNNNNKHPYQPSQQILISKHKSNKNNHNQVKITLVMIYQTILIQIFSKVNIIIFNLFWIFIN